MGSRRDRTGSHDRNPLAHCDQPRGLLVKTFGVPLRFRGNLSRFVPVEQVEEADTLERKRERGFERALEDRVEGIVLEIGHQNVYYFFDRRRLWSEPHGEPGAAERRERYHRESRHDASPLPDPLRWRR